MTFHLHLRRQSWSVPRLRRARHLFRDFVAIRGVAKIDTSEKRAREQAVIDAYRPICLCNKIRKGIVIKAIQGGAKTFDQVSKRTGIGTGPCGAARCGPMVRGMLGEEVETCKDCGWSILRGPSPLVCPRCSSVQQD